MQKKYWDGKDDPFICDFNLVLNILLLFLSIGREVSFLFAIIIGQIPYYNPRLIQNQPFTNIRDQSQSQQSRSQDQHSQPPPRFEDSLYSPLINDDRSESMPSSSSPSRLNRDSLP